MGHKRSLACSALIRIAKEFMSKLSVAQVRKPKKYRQDYQKTLMYLNGTYRKAM